MAMLAGCGSAPRIDRSFDTPHQASRVRYLVLHYTVTDNDMSVRIFEGKTNAEVSIHYLVTNEESPRIFRFVDESRVAYHGGYGGWKKEQNMNHGSIGIEIVNAGCTAGPQGMVCTPFPDRQIDTLIPLIRDIVKRHKIAPTNILGHSDIDPQRKLDPGALFPWKRLADEGLMAWPDETVAAVRRTAYEASLPDVAWFQKKLAEWGYVVPQDAVMSEATQRVLAAFQSKYRPARADGLADAETAALLDSPVILPPTPR